MRYSLRLLIFLMAIGPPTLALAFWRAVEFQELFLEQRLEAIEEQMWYARLNASPPGGIMIQPATPRCE